MACPRFTFPTLTTALPPAGSSSSSSSSPATPLSEISLISPNGGLLTPMTASDASKPPNNYVTYPEHTIPPRQLTPPPKSRFVPLFESISKSADASVDLSRRGSFGDDEASPTNGYINLPFSSTVTKQMRKTLSLTLTTAVVEPALRSAPLMARDLSSSSLWVSREKDSGPSKDNLQEIIRDLRRQLSAKDRCLQSAEADISRLSNAVSQALQEKAKLADSYARATKRIDELEALLSTDENTRPKPELSPRHVPIRWIPFQPAHTINHHDPKNKAWQEDTRKRIALQLDVNDKTKEDTPEVAQTSIPVSEEAYQKVLTKIPEMPSEVIIASLADLFRESAFDFGEWMANNGLGLPESMKKLGPMSWEERLRLDGDKLESLGVSDAVERSYIMRVLKAVAEGESPHLHPSIVGEKFSHDQYVSIMREQRIDKHVPNLSGIPWPFRLFVDEEDLTTLEVQKAGARGTIMTVFGGLRKGGPRPDPRPRRGTKKSKRGGQSSGSDFVFIPDNGQPYREKTRVQGKLAIGRQTPRITPPRDKAPRPHGHHFTGSNSSNSSWCGQRM
ncbi:hypothetical protein FS842_005294 [Serendipita sp. 407]|nr:hypothetical protein FS842_005294 [Serendipita sp. 407]